MMESVGMRAVRSAFVGAYDLVCDDLLTDLTVGAAEIVFSHAEANRLYVEKKARPGTRIEIVRRGIPLRELTDERPRDRFRWLTASSLTRRKNVEAVICAFAKAREREPRLRLDVYGDGPDRSRLEKLAEELGCSDVIKFEGHAPRDELMVQMQGASVFLLLSKSPSERLPNVVKEALWAGCAVISSDSDGISELIPHSGIGHVVNPDDSGALWAALEAVLGESDEAANERRRGARDFVAEHFSSERSMSRYANAWITCRADRRPLPITTPATPPHLRA
jgi:glycosyltransferase involved in cell wall biosynthesis